MGWGSRFCRRVADNLRMDGITLMVLAMAVCWTAICLLLGVEIGWRTRGGYSPMPSLPPLFGPPKPSPTGPKVEPPEQRKI